MKALLGLALTAFLAAPVLAEPTLIRPDAGEVTELWEGRAFTARFKVGMCFNAIGKARGVLLLRHANGQEDTYHLYGTIRDNEFNLSHSSGHTFRGHLVSPDAMEGKAKLKNGLSLTLSGKRIRDVELAAPDCAPLKGN